VHVNQLHVQSSGTLYTHRWFANLCQFTHVHPWKPHHKDHNHRHRCPHCSGHDWVPAGKWYSTIKQWVFLHLLGCLYTNKLEV